VWKYKCTDCAHYFCSSHCKDLWLRADDVDEDEEDPFTVLKDEEAPVDASELPFPHGDGASVVSSVAPSAAGSSSGSKSSTRLLCIECYAPRRMALLRAELYHTLDDLEDMGQGAPDDMHDILISGADKVYRVSTATGQATWTVKRGGMSWWTSKSAFLTEAGFLEICRLILVFFAIRASFSLPRRRKRKALRPRQVRGRTHITAYPLYPRQAYMMYITGRTLPAVLGERQTFPRVDTIAVSSGRQGLSLESGRNPYR
jgi:hypothetical protein